MSAASSILQLRRLDQPQIGRHHVAGLQQHDVAGHQLGGRADSPRVAVPQRTTRGGGGELLQRRHRALGAILLDEADDAR